MARWFRNDVGIDVNNGGRFVLDREEVEGVRVPSNGFDSLDNATDWIDRQLANAKRAKRVNLDFPVLSPSGVRVRVKGIHAGTGTILYAKAPPKTLHGRAPDRVYPDTPKVLEFLKRHEELQRQMKEVWDTLQSVSVSTNRRYGPEKDYDDKVKALRAELEAAEAKALKL